MQARAQPHTELAYTVRLLSADDADAWRALYNENNNNALADDVVRHTFSRLTDPASGMIGIVAQDHSGALVGILHAVIHPIAGAYNNVCYMQDVFVTPHARRQGVGKSMVQTLAAYGRTQNWDRIYWLAESNNTEAQAFYSTLGVHIDFSLHILPLAMLDRIGLVP